MSDASEQLLRRMSYELDGLSPDETIGYTDCAQWHDVATVAELRSAAYPPARSAATNDDALEYALGALRSIAASGKNSSPGQLAAMAQAGIDLATLGADKCAEMRGDADPRNQGEGGGPRS